MNSRNNPQSSVHIATARVDDIRANNFVTRVNDGLERPPYFRLDNPIILATLIEEYFSVIDTENEFLHRLGRVAARYLQKIPSPMTDRIPKPATDVDVLGAVASTIARSINERRRASAQERDTSE